MAGPCDFGLSGGEFGGGRERRIACSGGECWEVFWEEIGRGVLVFKPGGELCQIGFCCCDALRKAFRVKLTNNLQVPLSARKRG